MRLQRMTLLVVSMLHNNTSTVPNPNRNCVLYLISKYDVDSFQVESTLHAYSLLN